MKKKQIASESLENEAALLWRRYKDTGRALNAIPGLGSGAMGLTPDSVKARPDYQKAKHESRMAFEALREFNHRNRAFTFRRAHS